MGSPIPVGVNLTSIAVSSGWWLESARRLEAAGFRTAWSWDHFVSRGRLTDPVLECWTTLTAAAAATETLRVGSFVTNVMNRHPAVLARMAATLADQSQNRLELGIGIGGHPAEHDAYGIDFPEPAERAARLEEAISVLRLLFAGGPADFEGRFYRLSGAHAFPAPQPPPRIVVGAETPAGARLAARAGDAMTTFDTVFDKVLPVFEKGLASAGRPRSDVQVLVAIELDRSMPVDRQPALADLSATAERWHHRGADELVIHWVHAHELEAVLAAGERAGLTG